MPAHPCSKKKFKNHSTSVVWIHTQHLSTHASPFPPGGSPTLSTYTAIKNQVSWRHGLHWQASFKLYSTCTDSSTSCCCLLQATCYRVIKVTKAKPVTRINLPFTDKQARRKEVVRNAGWVSGPHSLSSTRGVIAVNACARGDSWFWLSYAFKTDSTV